MKINAYFNHFAKWSALVTGKAVTFTLAVIVIIAWALTGPMYHYSDTWQLVINTSTTIVTFLMVFLIQNSQNRDTTAIQLKLDEIIRALKGAQNKFLDLEDLTEEELEELRTKYLELAKRARAKEKRGHHDAGSPKLLDAAEKSIHKATSRQPPSGP